MLMNHKCNFPFVAALLVLLAGCIEKTERITLNPDGSGKSEFDMILAGDPGRTSINGQEQPVASPQSQLKDVVKAMLQSDDFDAWKDLKYEVTKDGRMHISGVAYFKDFNKRATFMGGGMSTESAERWEPIPNSPGGMRLSFDIGNEQKGQPKGKSEIPKSDAEIAEKITQAKMGWQQAKPMATAMLGSMKLDITYILPGKVTDAGAFQSVPGGVRAVVDGTKMLAAMDKINTDDAALRAAILAGRNPLQDPPADDQKGIVYLDKPGKPVATVEGATKPLFDYNAEVTAAKAALLETMKTLGMADVPAEVNTADKSGQSPLHNAVLQGDKHLVEALLAKGADVNAKDNFKQTPLYYAISGNRQPIVDLLIAKGADVTVTNFMGDSLLFPATFVGNNAIVELLLAKGVNVNLANGGGSTALHHAARFGQTAVAIILLDHGAKIDAVDNIGKSALAIAKESNQTEMVALLEKRGAK
jgi:hypothetical protein